MASCVAFKDNTQIKCGKPTEPGRKYCPEHSKRRGAAGEREKDAIDNVVNASEIFKKIDSEDEGSNPAKELAREQEATTKEARIPVEQRNIYDKTNDLLNRTITWEERTFDLLNGLSPEEMRYTDKAGAEQTHAYVGMHERAMDRVLRGVTAIAKLNIDAQSVNVNKMVRELIKACVTNTLKRMDMDQHEIDRARTILAEEFEKASGQAS